MKLGARETADLGDACLGRVTHPFTGFMGEADYKSSRDKMRLASGAPWSIPITLGVDEPTARSFKVGSDIALAHEGGARIAVMKVAEIYQVDREAEAKAVFGTSEDAHPGAKNVTSTPPYSIGGPVTLFEEIPGRTFMEYRLEPRATRAAFRERGWKKIVAFQTRNPTHRAHEYIQKAALEICDGLLLHPLVGETKGDDVPAAVRMETYKVLIDLYYPKNRVMLSVMPAHMRYGGPKEAILHAIIRRNYGCTHFIVGRDHAGVGSYYGTYDAQKIFDNFKPEEIGLTTLNFENTFFCKKCESMASYKTCPHADVRIASSYPAPRCASYFCAGQAPPPGVHAPRAGKNSHRGNARKEVARDRTTPQRRPIDDGAPLFHFCGECGAA